MLVRSGGVPGDDAVPRGDEVPSDEAITLFWSGVVGKDSTLTLASCVSSTSRSRPLPPTLAPQDGEACASCTGSSTYSGPTVEDAGETSSQTMTSGSDSRMLKDRSKESASERFSST